MKNKLKTLKVTSIDLDVTNPRIQRALDKYKNMGEITPARMYIALKGGGGDMNPQASFDRLKNSIKACGSILMPIIVNKEGGRYICIEGNTRLAIYLDFIKKEVDGNWQEIPCLVSDNLTDDEKEEIRLTAHLVPQRAWPAYERASHLYDLRHNKLNDFQQIINKMGGNQSSIERSMMAFQDMRDYYINKVDVVDPYRYSSFDELQKSNLKTVIMDKGFSLDDFGQWVINDNFGRNENVRLLKKVLNNEKATEIFLNKGVKSIERAEKYLNSLEIEPPELSSASIIQLAKTLSNKISNLASLQIEEIKSKDNDTFWELQNLHQTIDEIFIKKDGE
jgi:hypothetical protein